MMRAAALLLSFACVLSATGTDSWLKLTTADFELYTSAGEKQGRATLLHFEQVREFFLKASPVKKISDSPVRIMQFGSAKQFQPYGIRSFSPAYFLGTASRDYIVIGDPALELSVATHEYMHLIIQRSGLKIPAWLNEGWADVYSTLRPMGKETAIGDLLPGRMAELNSKEWLDFETLTSVDHRSPEYNEEGRAGIFYAESWALAHMLYLAPEYQQNFGKFVMALHQGKSASEACQTAWGRSSGKVFADLRAYFRRKQIFGRAFEMSLSKDQAEPAVAPLAEFDAQLALADLLAITNKKAEAQRACELLEKEQPGNAGVARCLGYLAGQSGDREKARHYFEKAFDAGDADPNMCLQLALLERGAGQPPSKTIPILERAVKARPDFADAQMQLGLTRLDAKDFTGAIDALMQLTSISADRASAVYCGLAYARIQTGDLPEARLDVETCRKWAKTDQERAGVDVLTRIMASMSTNAPLPP